MVATPLKAVECPSDNGPRTTKGIANWPGNVELGVTSYKGVAGGNWQWGDFQFTPPGGSGQGLDTGNGIFYRSDYKIKLTLTGIKDGTSNTLMIGEDIPSMNIHNAWCYSNGSTGTCSVPLNIGPPPLKAPSGINVKANNWPNVYSFRSYHTGGANFGMGDGTVQFVRDTIDIVTYRALASHSGGEVANLD